MINSLKQLLARDVISTHPNYTSHKTTHQTQTKTPPHTPSPPFMASLDSPTSPPTSPSFTIRPPSTTPFFLHSPPRFSSFTSPPSSPPRHSFTSKCISSILKKDGQILSIAASNGFIYTGSDSNKIRIWKLPELRECRGLRTKVGMVVALEVSHDRVYAAYGDFKIRVWKRTWDNHSHVLRHVRLGTLPASAGYVRSFLVGKDKTTKHSAPITSLAINISDDILYSSSQDKTVKVWTTTDFKCIETIQAHAHAINSIVLSDDGILYTASDDSTIRVWRRNFFTENQPHRLITTLSAKNSPVKTLTLTQDDNVLYGGCSDGYIHYWHKGWFSGQLQYGGALKGHTHAVMCMASVGFYVVSGSADGSCRVWVRESDGRHCVLSVLVGHRGPVGCVSVGLGRFGDEFEEECCNVCSGSLDGVMKMWRVVRGRDCSGCLGQSGCE